MKVIVTIFLATLMLPSLSWARSSTSTYTKNEIEAKFNELRTFYEARTAPQSEIASRFDTLEAKLKQLIDTNEGLANERGLLSRQVEDLQAQVKQNEQAEWDRNQLFVETLKSIQASSAEIAPEGTGHGLPLSKCEAYKRVYDQPYGSS